MESLYTKYRPQTFADVVGQTHVVNTLERAVIEGRTSHAYLFCGPRGTGKTTMARLLAKALMCEQGEGHLPDGTCDQCQMIAAGEHPDVYELDAASRTGVDNVRDEIISRVSFAPVQAPYKMYIIDEVHMLTTAAFNALLKTLEEPPAHVVFVLCTTDPQKIPETILSRVQRFDFHAISNADIQGRLAYICEREGFAYDPEALELVVRHARGGMRDAISELEQLSVSGGGSITVDVARDVLGEVSASTLERMSLAMAERNVPELFAQVEGLVEVGRDLLQFTRALAARLRDVYVVAAINASSNIVAASDEELPALAHEAEAFGSVDRVARALALLSDASTEMRVAPNQRLVLEVALTKIARPQTELTLDALADRVASLERQIVVLSVPEARRAVEAPRAAIGEAAREKSGAPAQRADAAGEAPRESVPAAPQQNAAQTEARSQQVDAARSAVAQSVPPQRAPQGAPRREEVAGASTAQAPSAVTPRDVPSQQAAQGGSRVSAPAVPQRTAPAAQGQPFAQGRAAAPVTPQRVAPAAQAQVAQPAAASSQSNGGPSAEQSSAVVDKSELQRRWKQVVDGLLASHPQHGSLLMNSTIVADDGHQLTVSFPKGSMFACRMLDRADVRANVDPMIASVFGPRKTRFAEGVAASAPQAAATGASTPAVPPRASQAPASGAPAQAPSGAVAQGMQPRSNAQDAARDQRTDRQAPPTAPASQEQPQQAAAQSAPAQQEPLAAGATQKPSQSVPATSSSPQTAPTQPSSQYLAPWEEAPVAPASERPPQVQSAPAQDAAAQPQQSTAWESSSMDDDMVPYDDFDASPYEEDYAFGLVSDPTPAPQAPPVSASPLQPLTGWQTPSAQARSAETPSYDVPSQQAPMTAAQPRVESNPWEASSAPQAPAQDPTPVQAPAPTPESVPPAPPTSAPSNATASASETASAPVQDASADAALASAKPKRTRRPAAAIPADIIAMMADVFGEGITYTSLEPEDDEAELEEAPVDEDSSEGEFLEEPVDDADYDEEE